MQTTIDPRLAPFLFIAEVTRAERFIGPLFARKLGGAPPDFGHHLVAFYARGDGAFLPASYLHLWTQGTIGLVGGGCTDGHVLRAMRPEEQRLVNEAGGLCCRRCATASRASSRSWRPSSAIAATIAPGKSTLPPASAKRASRTCSSA